MSTLPVVERRRFLPALAAPDLASIDPGSAIVVLPIGAVEQHGPHLPIFTDCLTVETVLSRAMAEVGERHNVWTLPLLPFSKSNEHVNFTGTISLSAETFSRVLREIGASLARAGFRKLLLLNGHGGNVAILEATARDMRVESGLLVFNSMCAFRSGLPAGRMSANEEKWGLHAGEVETSVIMAVAPAAVYRDRMAGSTPAFVDDYTLVGPTKGSVTVSWLADDLSPNGVIGDPTHASAETGRMAIDGAVRTLCQAFAEIARFEFPRSTPTGADGRVPARAG